jgi:hypothetical protein
VKTDPFSDVLGFVTQAGWTTSPEAVLASGDRLVAIAAIPCRLEDLVEKYGDQVRTSPLEVADEDAACAAVQVAGGRVGELGACGGGEVYRADMPFLCVPKPWGVIQHSIHSNDRGGTPRQMRARRNR